MKRFAIFALLILAGRLSAQTYGRLDFSLQNAQGQAISGAQVNVYSQSACGQPAAALAVLYPTATGGTPLTQPLLTDGFGHAFAYTLPGCVTITYNSPYTGLLTYADQNVALGGSFSIPIPISSGGTGATTVLGANGNLGVPGPVVNVIGSGAKGDCVTDDQTAINAALRLADTYAVNGSLPAEVYFPNPPGGCYKTSKMLWYGESLAGPPPGQSGTSSGKGGVIIQGMPGQDILGPPDPTTTNFPFYNPWTIQNIVFKVDDSVAPSFPHRWPGRWFDDGAMTSGSPVFSTARGAITCGDVGQAISVANAGNSGGTIPLVTTIASVSPCWSFQNPANNGWQTVTLASPALASVSNAHTYISVGNLPVTAHIGNAAIAFDDQDGDGSNWIDTGNVSNYGATLWNVTFVSVSGTGFGQNSSTALFFQGPWGPYKMDARNVDFNRLFFGNVEAPTELNSYDGGVGKDFQKWDHMGYDIDTYPWITYDGGENDVESWELTTAFGPQILSLVTVPDGGTGNWTISNMPEFENNSGAIGWQLTGANHTATNLTFSEGGSQNVYVETTNLRCTNCGFGNGTAYIDGYGNQIDGDGTTIVNRGRANKVAACSVGQPLEGMPVSGCYPVYPQKGDGVEGEQTADFLAGNNPTTPYSSNNDLFIWPQQVLFNGSTIGPPYFQYADFVVPDSGAPLTGYDIVFTAGQYAAEFSQFGPQVPGGNSSGHMLVGSTVPALQTTVSFSAKCATSTTLSFKVEASTGATVASGAFSCTTAFATYSLPANLTSYSGDYIFFVNNGSVAYDAAWIDVMPYQGAVNSTGPVNGSMIQVSGNQIATGNLGDWTDSGLANGNVPIWNAGTSKWTPGSASGITLTTTGSSGAATLTGSVLNIPVYAGGGSMTWPSTPGITVCTGTPCAAWGTSLTAPSGTILGTTDTQTVTNKTIDGVTPTTMAFVDPTSSIQTQLNAKAPLASPALTGTPTAPTQSCASNTDIATGAYVAACSGAGSVSDGVGTTTTPEFAESTTTAHVIQYRTPAQALGDMGAAPALPACSDESSTFTPANSTCYFVTASVSTATPAASAFVIFSVSTNGSGSFALTGTTITDAGNCSTHISGTTLTLPASDSVSVKSDGTNVWATCAK